MLHNKFNMLASSKVRKELSSGVKAYKDRGVPDHAIKIDISRGSGSLRYKLFVDSQLVPPSMWFRLLDILAGVLVVSDFLDPNLRRSSRPFRKGKGAQFSLPSTPVTFPRFEIYMGTEIPLTQIRSRRFDLIERSQASIAGAPVSQPSRGIEPLIQGYLSSPNREPRSPRPMEMVRYETRMLRAPARDTIIHTDDHFLRTPEEEK